MSDCKSYYLLPLGYINDGYQQSYDFDLSQTFCGSREECLQLFFSDMKKIYVDDWKHYSPQSITDIDIGDQHVIIGLLSPEKVLLHHRLHLNIQPVNSSSYHRKPPTDSFSLQLLSYATNGGLSTGFGALLLPKGQQIKINVIL